MFANIRPNLSLGCVHIKRQYTAMGETGNGTRKRTPTFPPRLIKFCVTSRSSVRLRSDVQTLTMPAQEGEPAPW